MESKSTSQPIEEYRRRYEDPRSAAEYQASLESPKTLRELLDLRHSLGWLITLAERRAISGLIRKTKVTGLIFDVPCGSGKLNPLWNPRDRVVGVDSSGPMLRHFLNNLGHEALQADILHLPVKESSVDLVICNRLLHRMPADRRAGILAEIGRVSSKWAVIYYGVFHKARSWIVQMNRKLEIARAKDVFLCTTEAARDEIRKSGWRIQAETSILMGAATGHVFLVERE